ncbi:MAG: transporter permease [Frankiales bacterium]|jgi:peptide/nickel transport system permease protein|nr:transporter permease [Frankiales bacterium]
MTLIAADEVAEQKGGGSGPDISAPAAIQGRTPLQLAWARLRKDKVSMACLVVIVLLILVAIFATQLTDLIGHGPNEQYRDKGLAPNGLPVSPSGFFWLGGDDVGRDVLSRIIHGTRISLLVGVVATAMAVIIGVVVGTTAGYFGGRVDTLLSRTMDVFLSFPFLLFAISLVSVFSPSVKISIFVIAFFTWANVGRIVRGQVLSIREKEYVEAARSLGAGDFRIMAVDVLPNLVAPIIVYSTLLIPTAIVFEATLSFLGLGVPIPTPTWGNMIAESQGTYQQAWWFLVFPSLALFITTLAFNLLGDGLRDALDPRAARVLARK